MNLQKKERVDKDFFSMTFYLDELFDIFLSPFYPVYTMCGHFLPLILLAALAVFFWPALGCENWPGKINLSCLFSFFLFNNGNYHQDYLAQRFLLVLVVVVLALTDKFISETCKIENVCRRNILSCIANCRTGNSSSSKPHYYLLPRSCFVGPQLYVSRDQFIATWNVEDVRLDIV